jgi:hypothetical protein
MSEYTDEPLSDFGETDDVSTAQSCRCVCAANCALEAARRPRLVKAYFEAHQVHCTLECFAQVDIYTPAAEQDAEAALNRSSVLGTKSMFASLRTSQIHVRNHTRDDIIVMVEWTNNSKQLSKQEYCVAINVATGCVVPKRLQEYVHSSNKVIGAEPFDADRTRSVAFSVGNARGALVTAISKNGKRVYCKSRHVPGGKRLTIIPGHL